MRISTILYVLITFVYLTTITIYQYNSHKINFYYIYLINLIIEMSWSINDNLKIYGYNTNQYVLIRACVFSCMQDVPLILAFWSIIQLILWHQMYKHIPLEAIDSGKTSKYSEDITKETCAICHDENCDFIVEKCEHFYHRECLDKWCETASICPICKISIY